ncbi:MAG: hypothetical protein CYPHOPRED_005857 [Cyphobasidiales sp. Tagirdzhanova-0007]|nr:MAG: hypothetical protein CYPHOPRED_005857 [Cyphobasidiales sp. Tagirdzhanova-0007]
MLLYKEDYSPKTGVTVILEGKMTVKTTPKKNTVFVVRKIDDVGFEDRPVPDPAKLMPDDVLVAPKATGICGSDVHFVQHGRIGDFILEKPMILGHECAGVVLAVGTAVEDLKKGDRVALEPGEPCRRCEICKAGRYNLCKKVKFAATPPTDGTLAGYYVLPGDFCYKLPEDVTLEEGSFLEPLSVAVHAVANIGTLRAGQNVAIFGAGPVGLLSMAVANALGARRVIGIDIQQDRLDFARSYAATDIWKSTPAKPDESMTDCARRQTFEMRDALGIDLETGPESMHLVIDCTGAEACITCGVFLVADAGTCVQVGIRSMNASLPVQAMTTREITFKGSWRYRAGVYKQSLNLIAQKKVDLKRLITHRYAFEDAEAAFQCMIDGKGADGKTPIKCIIAGPEDG